MMRHFPEFDRVNIRNLGLKGVQKFCVFSALSSRRSHEPIKSFVNSTMTKNSFTALFCDRTLQVYDFIHNKLEFQVNMPSEGSYLLK